MARDDTQDRTGTGQGALVALSHAETTGRRNIGGRPLSSFLTQLIVGNDPALRPTRLDRTRQAAALYASAASRA